MDDIDYAGLVSALIGLITAVSALIRIYNKRKTEREDANSEKK